MCKKKMVKNFHYLVNFLKKCKKPKGFTMKASSAPYKGCKN